VLIVYDPNSVHGSQYRFDVNPSNIAVRISDRETALGFTPTTIGTYDDFLALSDTQIADYAHIWDVGYDTMITSPVATRYQTYLQNGGAMFFLGENGYFVNRDSTIVNFITLMGGGSIAVNNGHYYGTAEIQTEFLLATPDAGLDFYDVADFTSYGTGTPMVITTGGQGGVDPDYYGPAGAPGLNVATVWKTGSLSNAPSAAICAILDVNWLDTVPQLNLIDNLSVVLNKK
jgi:hypothetical protein